MKIAIIFLSILTATIAFQFGMELNMKKLANQDLTKLENVRKNQENLLAQNDSFNGWKLYENLYRESNVKMKRKFFISQFKKSHNIYSIELNRKNFILLEYQARDSFDTNKAIKLYYFNNDDLKSEAVLVGEYLNVLVTSSLEKVSNLIFKSADSLVVQTSSFTFSDIINDGKTLYLSDTITTYYNFGNNEITLLDSDTLKYSWEE
ncbi:hypothetical protein [Ekhidna sp.]|uniref:hypothetical protein n=1 Tax=Ekhidna sp. TaxID=2608089 RepID=UPI0035124121